MAQGNPLDVLEALPQSWERLSEEGVRAYAAFSHYRDLDPEMRSITRAAELSWEKTAGRRRGKFETVVRRFEEWSALHYWPARAQQHDDFLAREQYEAEVVARREMGRRHAEAADALLSKAMVAIEQIKPEEISVAEAARWVEIAVRLGRLVRGSDEPEGAPVGADPQDLIVDLLSKDPELTKAGARFGAQILRAEREAEEAREV